MKYPILIILLFFLISMASILLSPQIRVYDEIFYIPYIENFKNHSNIIQYTRDLEAPPGPTYAFLHALFDWGSEVNVVQKRILTNCFYLVSAVFCLLAARLSNFPNFDSVPLLFYAVPFAATSYGIALTEIPAMLMLSIAILAVISSTYQKLHFPTSVNLSSKLVQSGDYFGTTLARYGMLFLGSLFFGLAVWGRQNYLVVLFALPVLFFAYKSPVSPDAKWYSRFRCDIWGLLIAALPALIASIFLFWIWGGLVPQSVRYAAEVDQLNSPPLLFFGLNLDFLLKSLGYAAISFCILAPAFFICKRMVLFASGIVAISLVTIFHDLRFCPSPNLLKQIPFIEVFFPMLEFLVGGLFCFLSVWLLASALFWMWSNRCNSFYVFCLLSWLLLLASNMKISHQFSSRYVLVAVPFIVLTSLWHFRFSKMALLRLCLGFIVSNMLLTNYYLIHK
jgi:hypothetical protein